MRKRKPEAERKKPGLPPRRPFYNKIGFQVAPSLHAAMNDIAQERRIRFEDVYTEAVQKLLDIRNSKTIVYTPSPPRRFAKRVTVFMEPSLAESARIVSQQDQQRLVDFFQTAAWLYLDSLNRLPS
ncbi:MAG: hypothetical protein WAS21_14950 [Geminicoccaceae bacterium]